MIFPGARGLPVWHHHGDYPTWFCWPGNWWMITHGFPELACRKVCRALCKLPLLVSDRFLWNVWISHFMKIYSTFLECVHDSQTVVAKQIGACFATSLWPNIKLPPCWESNASSSTKHTCWHSQVSSGQFVATHVCWIISSRPSYFRWCFQSVVVAAINHYSFQNQ
jgi:hypothetical protein